MELDNSTKNNQRFKDLTEILIRLGMLSLIVYWCYSLLKPFILLIIWGIVIAVALHPTYLKAVEIFKGKKTLTVVILTLFLLSIIIIPSFLVVESLYEGVSYLTNSYQSGQPIIPPPNEVTATWPKFTQPIIEIWQHASENLQDTLLKYSEELTTVGTWLLSAFAGVGKGILQFNASIIIAGILLVFAEDLKEVSSRIFTKLVGEKGDYFASVTVATIQNVVKGFLGVAIIQAILAGIGFFVAGVPFAGLWTVLCLVLAVIQIGIGPIAIPVAIYMFSVADSTTAIVLSIWLVLTMVSDNILKPILLGKNAPVPMPVVFLGAIGGFMLSGFLGLFLGAVILTIGYKLFLTWLDLEKEDGE